MKEVWKLKEETKMYRAVEKNEELDDNKKG